MGAKCNSGFQWSEKLVMDQTSVSHSLGDAITLRTRRTLSAENYILKLSIHVFCEYFEK